MIDLWKRLNYKSRDEFKMVLSNMYFNQKLSQAKIAKQLKCDTTCIENWFKTLGIPTRNAKEYTRNTKEKHIIINSEELEIFDGLMISDIHIEKGVFQSRASFAFKHLEFAEKIVSKTPSFRWGSIKYNNKSISWYSKTIFNIEMHHQRQRWYKNNIKIVPEDIKITQNMLLWWYLGDGYITKYGAVLCTDCFTIEENNKLVELIKEKNIPCHRTPRNRIRIEGNDGTKQLLSYIGRSPVKCYEYKWGEYIKEVMPL